MKKLVIIKIPEMASKLRYLAMAQSTCTILTRDNGRKNITPNASHMDEFYNTSNSVGMIALIILL